MKHRVVFLLSMLMMLISMASCRNEQDEPYFTRQPVAPYVDYGAKSGDPLWERHHDSRLKILAIGNSFTINATSFMPWLVSSLNRDSICVARLTRSGCSLKQHWLSHISNGTDYEFLYSDSGDWKHTDINTLDEALTYFDWDIITIQQVSGHSGLYSTYQPYLDNLIRLFRETHPGALIAWHYTWAYTSWTQHGDFKNYGSDSQKMYEAIIEAGDKASELVDLGIPSATLIKRMREEFPEVENGFSSDGYHLVDDLALYALSSLWYEVLVSPVVGSSSIDRGILPQSVDADDMARVNEIIKDMLGLEDSGSSGVPMIRP